MTYKETSLRREKKIQTIITVNPNELKGMKELMAIIFTNKNIEVTQLALKEIGFYFDHLDEKLAGNIGEFKNNFLEKCLSEFYATKDQQ